MVATEVPVRIQLRGGVWEAYNATEREVLVEGGAGTGKTFGILLRLNRHAQENPGYHGAIIRKTAVSLAGSVLRTFEEQVLHEWDFATRSSKLDHVHFFGGSQNEPASYEYDNGSRIVVGGMDNPSKVLSTDYDEVYFNEATESSLEDWETLLGRLRHDVLDHRTLIGDCNPSHDRHYLLSRARDGQLRRIKTTLRDNPAYWQEGAWTSLGAEYLATLESMTGTRRQRFLLGEWVGMENAIYAEAMDASKQLVELPQRIGWTGRAWGGMDYGRVHLSAVVSLQEASDGYVWVREVWAEAGGGKEQIKDAARSARIKYGVKTGVTDPIQEWAAQELGWKPAKSGMGSRKGRIERVLSLLEGDKLRFDRFGAGVQDLWDEMMMYRYEVRETDTVIEDVVVRKDDDRVAALEYAVEAMEKGVTTQSERVVRPLDTRRVVGA